MFDLPYDYKVVDVSDQGRSWAVVCEATTRKPCEDYLIAKRLAECDVFKEHKEELYRGICPVIEITSDANNGGANE